MAPRITSIVLQFLSAEMLFVKFLSSSCHMRGSVSGREVREQIRSKKESPWFQGLFLFIWNIELLVGSFHSYPYGRSYADILAVAWIIVRGKRIARFPVKCSDRASQGAAESAGLAEPPLAVN